MGMDEVKIPKEGMDGLGEMMEKMQIDVIGRENGAQSDDDFGSDDDSDEEEYDEAQHFQEGGAEISAKHAKFTDLEERAVFDRDFPDEVDCVKDARTRFNKYRGIKSLRNCDWDPYENLPADYSKIWRFQSFVAAQKDSVTQAEEEGLPLGGTYVNIVLEVPKSVDAATAFKLNQSIIASTLFPHECKLSVMHFKLKRTLENKDSVPSKTLMEFHAGFRRVQLKPSFSLETNPGAATEKYKYSRFLRDDCTLVASAICPIIFAPCKVIAFTEKSINDPTPSAIVATGVVMPPNPMRIILKRIILTGYPLRCHKKKGVIRYMFFEPKDIKWFKPVEVYTKNGLRGHIKSSLGMHGLMKCVFNDFLKQNDVVCMPLYKRIFPEWHEKAWNPEAIEQIKPKKEVFDKDMEVDHGKEMIDIQKGK